MEISVIVFPGSNCDRDIAVSLKKVFKRDPKMVWHKEQTLPKSDLIVLPGGFSYGDYLRCGSMAANSPIMSEIIKYGESGTFIIGICNGFQILTETNLLPGTLIRNRDLSFICKNLPLKVENSKSRFTHKYSANEIIEIPVAHNEGNYFAPEDLLKQLKEEGRIA
ncbi:MAG: phosphoribosylformylglycinamidine synthase subunit PurQ, partial [Pseudomonadota bacterium]|nr:phosphoribosylformylglycinamidine synthase subunit PurQ [Pseudomonadota bacterium]